VSVLQSVENNKKVKPSIFIEKHWDMLSSDTQVMNYFL